MVELEADDALASAARLAAGDTRVGKVCIWTPERTSPSASTATAWCRSTVGRRRCATPRGCARNSASSRRASPTTWRSSATAPAATPQPPRDRALATAARPIRQYGPRHAPPSILGEQRELALLFRRLATLRTDAPLFADVDEPRWRGRRRRSPPGRKRTARLGSWRVPGPPPRPPSPRRQASSCASSSSPAEVRCAPNPCPCRSLCCRACSCPAWRRQRPSTSRDPTATRPYQHRPQPLRRVRRRLHTAGGDSTGECHPRHRHHCVFLYYRRVAPRDHSRGRPCRDITCRVILDGATAPEFLGACRLLFSTARAPAAGVSGLRFVGGSGGSTLRALVVQGFSGNGVVVESDPTRSSATSSAPMPRAPPSSAMATGSHRRQLQHDRRRRRQRARHRVGQRRSRRQHRRQLRLDPLFVRRPRSPERVRSPTAATASSSAPAPARRWCRT